MFSGFDFCDPAVFCAEVCRDPSHQYGLLHRLDRNTSGPKGKIMIRGGKVDRYPIQKETVFGERLFDFKKIKIPWNSRLWWNI